MSTTPMLPDISSAPTSFSSSGEPLYSVDYGNPNGVATLPDTSYSGALVIPDTSMLNLPGQMPGLPGGGASNGHMGASDPSGVNGLYLDPTVNPTPTGGYMSALDSVLKAASTGFSTYVKGSPSVAIPPPKKASGGMLSSVLSGTTNWMVVGVVVVAGMVAMGVLAVKA